MQRPRQYLDSASASASKMGESAKKLSESAKRLGASAYARVPQSTRELIFSVSRPGGLNRALALQVEALWDRHGRKFIIAAGCGAAYLLWRSLFGVASTFINLSQGVAEWGFLAFAMAAVYAGTTYVVRRHTISADAVYRLAMLKLNMHPGVLEVMGAPLAGSTLRAYVVTGGGMKLKGLLPHYRPRRMQMIFPLKGADRRGLVSIETKKRQGKYDFKLLCVDAPTPLGGEERLYLAGDESVYTRGSIMGELRDPFLRALSLRSVYDEEDEADEVKDDAAEARAREEKAADSREKAPKPLDQGGGMYWAENVYWTLHGAVERVRDLSRKIQTRNLSDHDPAKR